MSNLMGTGIFGGFIDPTHREFMDQARKRLALGDALSPMKMSSPGVGAPGLTTSPSKPAIGGGQSIFARFANGAF